MFRCKLSLMPLFTLLIGTAASSETISPKIINGINTPANSLPWQVAVNFDCGGSIIDNKWVVTAAHCVEKNGNILAPTDVEIFAHSENINDNTNGKSYVVEQVIVHPGYLVSFEHDDIALLKISDSLLLGENTNTEFPANTAIKLLPATKQTELDLQFANDWVENQKRNPNLLVSGWGATDPNNSRNSYTSILKQTLLSGVPDSVCATHWQSIPGEKTVCAASPDPTLANDSCFGDSGGPLVWQDPSHINDPDKGLRLAGIVSYGEQRCGTAAPAVYTQAANYISWIETNINKSLSTIPTSTYNTDPFKVNYSKEQQHQEVNPASGDDDGGSLSIGGLIALFSFGWLRHRRQK